MHLCILCQKTCRLLRPSPIGVHHTVAYQQLQTACCTIFCQKLIFQAYLCTYHNPAYVKNRHCLAPSDRHISSYMAQQSKCLLFFDKSCFFPWDLQFLTLSILSAPLHLKHFDNIVLQLQQILYFRFEFYTFSLILLDFFINPNPFALFQHAVHFNVSQLTIIGSDVFFSLR